MASEMINPFLRDLSVGITRHRFVQDLPQFGGEALVGQMYEDISLCVSDIEGAHSVIMRRFIRWRQRIVFVSESFEGRL